MPRAVERMARRSKDTLNRDRARTAAISRYVADRRDELLRDISDQVKANKNIKRQELLRLGRLRFHAESEVVQRKYLADHASARKEQSSQSTRTSSVSSGGEVVVAAAPDSEASTLPGGADVVAPSAASSDSEATLPGWCEVVAVAPHSESSELPDSACGAATAPISASSGGQVVEAAPNVVAESSGSQVVAAIPDRVEVSHGQPKRARLARSLSLPTTELELVSVTMAARSASQPTTELRQVMSQHIPWLWKEFGSADGALILSTSYRWVSFAAGLRDRIPGHVVAAAVLGLAMKFHGKADSASVRKVWCRVAGSPNIEDVKAAEHHIFEAGAVDNLPGDFASERQLALIADVR